MRRLHERSAVTAAALTVLLVAGCGDGTTDAGDADGETTASPSTTASGATSASPSSAEPTTAEPSTAEPSTAEPSATTPTATPTAAPTPTSASAGDDRKASASPVGRWRNKELEWVLRIKANGRFVDDFAGVKNIRSGRWRLARDTVVVLEGGDGVTTRGRLKGNRLTIRGTVLVRVR